MKAHTKKIHKSRKRYTSKKRRAMKRRSNVFHWRTLQWKEFWLRNVFEYTLVYALHTQHLAHRRNRSRCWESEVSNRASTVWNFDVVYPFDSLSHSPSKLNCMRSLVLCMYSCLCVNFIYCWHSLQLQTASIPPTQHTGLVFLHRF